MSWDLKNTFSVSKFKDGAFVHKTAVPLTHAVLWCMALLLPIAISGEGDTNAAKDVDLAQVSTFAATLVVFMFELAVTFYDLKVSLNIRAFSSNIMGFMAIFCGLVAFSAFFLLIYFSNTLHNEPHNNCCQAAIAAFAICSSALKFLEYRLVNCIDDYAIQSKHFTSFTDL